MEAFLVAEQNQGPLSEWLELMLAEITRRQEEAQAGDIEQAARALQPPQGATSDERQRASSQSASSPPSRAAAQSRPTSASRTDTPQRARSA